MENTTSPTSSQKKPADNTSGKMEEEEKRENGFLTSHKDQQKSQVP
jgi:hypothetical protein